MPAYLTDSGGEKGKNNNNKLKNCTSPLKI
jgi:hypothetical protein